MRELRLRDALTGPRPAPDRILYSNLWFGDHNNQRYEQLLPRLARLDAVLLHASAPRIPRGVQYRAWRGPLGTLGQRALGPRAARRYRGLFSTDYRQLALFPGPIVVDVDDTDFGERDLALFRRPNVVALVTTSGGAAERLASLGVTAPVHVVPQGVSLGSVSAEAAAGVRRRLRRDGDVVVGWMAAWLLSGDDRDGDNPLYNVDHLLDLWDELHARVPEARLWLIGGASARVRDRVAGRDDVLVLGRLPREEMLAHVASFDLGVYARTADQGIQAAKVAEYMGLGVPTVSYDYEVTQVLRQTGAGVLVDSPREFVDTLERLAHDEPQRRRLADAARAAGRQLDWDVLARRYETEILDRYLPPRPYGA